ncbi:MAG: AzlC family ABC transporter permease [Ruminococcaceae bacterium]|nr:AzlC family ABC transporter permease [Oscillospiraceae bacterium]
MSSKSAFLKGIKAGLPICFGYLSVAFAFGIFALSAGLDSLQALLISMTNVTSAGQLAAVPIMVGGGTLFELAASQFVINLRYSLMSVSLSQKFDKSFRLADKLLVAFVVTDEVFAVAASQKGEVGKHFMYGLILTPYIGWSAGTILGAVAGNVLPAIVISALGIAIYAMFIAIVIPAARENKKTLICVLIAVALSLAFHFVPLLKRVPGGFVVIICAVAASALAAWLFPVKSEEEGSAV